MLAGADRSPDPSAADIAAAIARAPATYINWLTFTGGGVRRPRRGKFEGPGLGHRLPGRITSSGGGTEQGDGGINSSAAGSSFVVKYSDVSTSGISSSA